MMAALRPLARAIVKNVPLMVSLWGRPKEILETPRMVFPPSSSRTLLRVSRVVNAPRLSELTVRQRPSIRISFDDIPYSAAFL